MDMHDHGGAMRQARSLLLALAMALVASSVAAEVPDTPEPTQVPLMSASSRPDLYQEMPHSLGGFEPDVVMIRGREHFEGLAQDDPTRTALEGLLGTLGAEPDDMVSGYALVSGEGDFSFVVAIRIEGTTPGELLPAYLPILLGSLHEPTVRSGRGGGKEVTVVTSVGDDGGPVDLYVYDEGDTLWMIEGGPDVVEDTLADLPAPLGS